MILGFCGTTFSGKTTGLRIGVREVAEAVQRGALPLQRLRILDADGSFVGHGPYSDVGRYRAALAQNGGRIPVVATFAGDTPDALGDLAALVDAEGGILVVDELPRYLVPGLPLDPALLRVAFRGRRLPKTALWWSSHALALVPRSIRIPTRILYLFRQTDWPDLARARAECGREVAAILPTLKDLQYLRIDRTGAPLDLTVHTLQPLPCDFAGRTRG